MLYQILNTVWQLLTSVIIIETSNHLAWSIMRTAAERYSFYSLKDDLLPHVTGGFRGRKIRVASMEYSPWMIYERDQLGNKI